MSLVKTSLLNGLATVVKLASALVLNKILAVYVGPTGYAVIGQFQNAVSIVVSLAGGLVATGVTKATAQHFDEELKQHAIWQTAIRLSLVASAIAAIPLLAFSERLALLILHHSDMSSIAVWLAFALPAIATNNLLLAIVNGKKEIGIYATANILGSLIALLIVGLLASKFGLYGALVAFAVNPAIVLLVTGTILARREWFKAEFLFGRVNRAAIQELSGFALMGLTSALTAPTSYMLIRDHLASSLGLNAAGYWQASWKISEMYLMLITTTLSAYYLPRLAEIRNAKELKTEIVKVYKFVMPLVITGAATIFILRDLIISMLFTPEFSPMRDLLPWQLAGDVIKIGSWVLAYTMLGRAMVKVFVITEITFSVLLVLSSRLFVDHYGLVGASIAYSLNYIIYWIAMVFLIKREMRSMPPNNPAFD